MNFIKTCFKWLWNHSDNQHQLVVLSITLVLSILSITVFITSVDIKGKTAFGWYHDHTTKPIYALSKAVMLQNGMILASNDKSGIELELMRIEISEAQHQNLIYHAIKDNGDFKSDFHKKVYEENGARLKRVRGKIEKKLEVLDRKIDSKRQLVASLQLNYN